MFNRLPKTIQETVYRKLALWQQDPSHSSLRIKPMRGHPGIWEMSVTMNYRVTFENKTANTILLRKVGTHDILRNP